MKELPKIEKKVQSDIVDHLKLGVNINTKKPKNRTEPNQKFWVLRFRFFSFFVRCTFSFLGTSVLRYGVRCKDPEITVHQRTKVLFTKF